jgi:hypothetical protein
MIHRILRLLGFRRRVSTKLNPKYEARRVAELRKARAMFEGARHA